MHLINGSLLERPYQGGIVIKSISRWDINDLDQILRKGDELFKSLNEFKSLGVEDLPTKIEIYSYFIDIALLENRTG